MTSKARPAAQKRAAHVRNADKAKQFRKDWTKLSHSGRYDMHRLKAVMTAIIANDGPLPAEHKDHQLEGAWADHRECHVGGDFLLIYKLHGTGPDEVVIFVRAGTHADLFE